MILFITLFNSTIFCEEGSFIALPGHELGDQIFSLRAGLIFPLFYHDFDEFDTYDSNSTFGATGTLQWNFYLTSVIRVGLDVGLAFALDPNDNLYNMVPITGNVTYVISVSRFEFPISFSAGINILNFQDFYNSAIILKPAIAGYWRYDANLSFGINLGYWWSVEFPSGDNPWVAGNFLEITPSLFYHF